MKARFNMKWRKGADGVFHGFRDPDALTGRLKTNSPTASRLARQTLLTIAAAEEWPMAMANVQTALLSSKETGMDVHVELQTPQQCWALHTCRT